MKFIKLTLLNNTFMVIAIKNLILTETWNSETTRLVYEVGNEWMEKFVRETPEQILNLIKEGEKQMKYGIEEIIDNNIDWDYVDSEKSAEQILALFKTKIDDIPKTELMCVFDKYRSKDKDGDIVLYGVYFIDIVLDILNIIKNRMDQQ